LHDRYCNGSLQCTGSRRVLACSVSYQVWIASLNAMVLEAADPARASATPDERAWIRVIQAETHAHAGDNIDRTHAYQQFWLANPEIHWALLASLVSRNTGYMMTDLGGEPLGRLLDRTVARRLFLSLERCNWLIFQDAYPQLLLYSLSKTLGRPMFHLLPALGHSTGMVGVLGRLLARSAGRAIGAGADRQRAELHPRARRVERAIRAPVPAPRDDVRATIVLGHCRLSGNRPGQTE
jgi:uncharacterized protein DUF2515